MIGKKRFVAMGIALLLMALGCVVYVAVHGNSYTDRMIYYTNDYLTDDDLEVTVDKPDVVRADRIYHDDSHTVCVDYVGLREGTATATIRLHIDPSQGENEGWQTEKQRLYVNGFHTVFNTDFMNFDGFFFVEIVILAGLILVFLTMGATFAECFFKARFSYTMVACGGIALFTLFAFVLEVYQMQWFNSFRGFLLDMADSGFEFSVLTSPFMLLFAGLIAFSNIWLVRHEGFRLQNMLGIALAVLWVLGVGLLFWLTYSAFQGSEAYFHVAERLSYSLSIVLSFMECMLLSTVVSAFLSTKYKPPHNKDYLIILGCCIRKDGTLTPILRGRVDAAIKFEREQFAQTNKHAKFVPSGGEGDDEVISESEAMRRYLLEQGYPEEQIVTEDKSVNTSQNIQFSRDRIREDAGTLDNIRAGFATTNYHIFRGYILSRKHGLDAQGISAKTKWYFFPNAFLREFAGLLFDKKWFIAGVIAAILILFTLGVQFLDVKI